MVLINKHACWKFIINPSIHPSTGSIIQSNKGPYNELVDACKTNLSKSEIKRALSILEERDDKNYTKLYKKFESWLIGRSRRSHRRSNKRSRISSKRSWKGMRTMFKYNRPKISLHEIVDDDTSIQNIKAPVNYSMIINDINADSFIINILNSEKRINSKKMEKYKSFIANMENQLVEHDKKIAILKTNNIKPSESETELSNGIKRKIVTFKGFLTRLQTRNVELANITSTTINNKRAQLLELVQLIENFKGDSRMENRNQLYTNIKTLAISPELYLESINSMIVGSAGIGKTTYADVLAKFYYAVGITLTNNIKVASRQDFISSYIGESAKRTLTLLDNYFFEGVVFIDEAYSLTGCPDEDGRYSSRDYSQEAIAEIIKFIDDYKGLGVLIVAGYKKKMYTCFLGINEGMDRRFPYKIELINYSSEDLTLILLENIINRFKGSRENIGLSESQAEYIAVLINELNNQKLIDSTGNPILVFSNQAGDMVSLASYIIRDMLITTELKVGGYDQEEINNTFKRFLSNKGLSINFI